MMAPRKGKFEEILEPILAGLDLELVMVEHRRAGRKEIVRVFIDKPGGVDIDTCERASRAVISSGKLEQVVDDYVLEVSSPGLDRPLVKPAHYKRFVGHKVSVKLARGRDGRKKFSGRLSEAGDESFFVELAGGREHIAYSEVVSAHLVYEPD